MYSANYTVVAMVARGRNTRSHLFWLVHQSRASVLDIPRVQHVPGRAPRQDHHSIHQCTPIYKHNIWSKLNLSTKDIMARQMKPHTHMGIIRNMACNTVLLEFKRGLLDRIH